MNFPNTFQTFPSLHRWTFLSSFLRYFTFLCAACGGILLSVCHLGTAALTPLPAPARSGTEGGGGETLRDLCLLPRRTDPASFFARKPRNGKCSSPAVLHKKATG